MVSEIPLVDEILPELPEVKERRLKRKEFEQRVQQEEAREPILTKENIIAFGKKVKKKVTPFVKERLKPLSIKTAKALQRQLAKTPPKPKTVTVPLKDVMGITKQPKKVNPLQPNIESLIFPHGRAPPLSFEPRKTEGKILKQKSLFWK